MPCVGLDTSALDSQFKEHAARGIGRYVRELKSYFETYPPPDLRVTFFDHKGVAPLPLAERVLDKFPAGKMTLKSQVLYPIRLGLSRKFGLDVLHFPAHMDAPAWSPKRYIVTVLDMIPFVLEKLYRPERPSWRFALARWLEKCAIRNAALVLVISENTAKDVNRILNISFDRIAVTPLGVDAKFFGVRWGEENLDLRRRYGIPAAAPVILYVGGIDQRKNWAGLLEAFKGARELRQHRNLEAPVLFMAGKIQGDRQFPKLMETVKRLNLEPFVLMPGFIPEEDLLGLYGLSRVLCFLSYYEGFGLTPLEAMAAGLPVVSSNTSCMPEVLQDAAILLGPDETVQASQVLVALLEREELARKYSEKGRKHAKKYSWTKTGELTLDAYRRVLRGFYA